MANSLRRAGALAALSLTLLAACSSEPTSTTGSPLSATTAAPSAELPGGLTQTVSKLLTTVIGVQRNTPLTSSSLSQ